jgi:hypothetical protein
MKPSALTSRYPGLDLQRRHIRQRQSPDRLHQGVWQLGVEGFGDSTTEEELVLDKREAPHAPMNGQVTHRRGDIILHNPISYSTVLTLHAAPQPLRRLGMNLLGVNSLLLGGKNSRRLNVEQAQQSNVSLRVEHLLSLPSRSTTLVAKDSVELVQSSVLCLGNQEQDVSRCDDTHESEENVSAVRGLGDKVGGGHGDGKVVEPVGTSSDRDTLGSETERVDLSDKNPSAAQVSMW